MKYFFLGRPRVVFFSLLHEDERMYCSKCQYHGHDHITACPKCGASWEEARKALGLVWLEVAGHPWLTLSPQPETIASDLLDVDAILTPPALPEPTPPSASQTPIFAIDDLPAPGSAQSPPPAADPSPGSGAELLSLEIPSVPEIEVELPSIEVPDLEPQPSAASSPPILDPLDETTPEETFLERLSAEMPATDHIILEPETSAPVQTDALELDLVLEQDAPSEASPATPPRPEPPQPSSDLIIPDLEELLGPPTPPAGIASPDKEPWTTPKATEDDFAIILLDDSEENAPQPPPNS
jgi:hypothetical protein